MERPNIKGFFGENVTLKQVHETYLNQTELFNYAQALDRYIDELEDKVSAPLSKSISDEEIMAVMNNFYKARNLCGNDVDFIVAVEDEFASKLRTLLSSSISDQGIKDWDFVFKEYAEQRANTLDLFEFLKFLKQHYPVPVSGSDAKVKKEVKNCLIAIGEWDDATQRRVDNYFLPRTINEGGDDGR